jgi:hypothetical protein
MGGLLWLAFQGHVWAREIVAGAWPLFILGVGTVAVMVVTDRNDIMGKSVLIAGAAIMLVAALGSAPEATLVTLGPWALVVMGAVLALGGLGPRGRPVGEGAAIGTDVRSLDTRRAYKHGLNLPLRKEKRMAGARKER